MIQIAQGAESKLYEDKDCIIKDRFEKKYRLKEIDQKLRKFRTKREAKILEKLSDFSSPKLISTDKKQEIVMEKINGPLVKDILENDYKKLSYEIGKLVAGLHNKNIIHGDLTTSNMIFNKKIFLIDFGLSFFSHKIEDKAVDLKLLRQALESKHYKVYKEAYNEVLKAYKKYADDSENILKRLEKVEKRGRYKGKK